MIAVVEKLAGRKGIADPKTENSNNNAATSVNRLKNADFGNGPTQKVWTIGEKIHF